MGEKNGRVNIAITISSNITTIFHSFLVLFFFTLILLLLYNDLFPRLSLIKLTCILLANVLIILSFPSLKQNIKVVHKYWEDANSGRRGERGTRSKVVESLG